jgi:plasmid stabilization system protein ParE
MAFYDIELSQKATLELDEAFNWYNAKIEGLGIRLLREIDAHLSQIITNPNIYQIRFEEDIRVAPLKVFPYLIIYWIDQEKEKIVILSIFHVSRNPESIFK